MCTSGIARAGIADLQPVVDEVGERHRHGEQARFDVLEHIPVVADQRHHFHCMRTEHPDHRVIAVFMRAQNRVRVVMHTGQQALEVGGIGPQVRSLLLIASRHLVPLPCAQGQSWIPMRFGMFSTWATALRSRRT